MFRNPVRLRYRRCGWRDGPPSITAFAIQRYYLAKRQYITVTGKPGGVISRLVSARNKWLLYAVAVLFFLIVVVFYAVILVGATTRVWGSDNTLTLEQLGRRDAPTPGRQGDQRAVSHQAGGRNGDSGAGPRGVAHRCR